MSGFDHCSAVKAKLAQFGEMTPEQLGGLVAFAKLVRFRARSNAALINLCNAMFPQARFRQVSRVNQYGKPYEVMEITYKGVIQIEGDDSE